MIKKYSFVALCLMGCVFTVSAKTSSSVVSLSELAQRSTSVETVFLLPEQSPVRLNVERGVNVKNNVTQKIIDKYKVSPDLAQHIVNVAHQQAQSKNVDPLLVLSIVAVESGFDPHAKNNGAVGLMQTIPRWHRDKIQNLGLSTPQLTAVEPNLKLGVEIFKEYLKLSGGNLTLALQKYNGSTKDKSRRYSNKIMRHYNWLAQKDM